MKKTTFKNLNKRLSQYTALSAAVIGVAEAHGQVGGPTVVDIDILTSTNYDLDMDGDTTPDFRLINNGSFLLVEPRIADAEIIGSSAMSYGNTYRYPLALNSSNIISDGASGTWFNNSAQSMNVSSTYGNWVGVTDKYLGLRFKISGVTHYGWAKLDVATSPDDGVNINSYYYNPNPNDPIGAGLTKPLSVSDNNLKNIKIISRNNGINLINIPNEISYNLYDLSGKLILEGITNNRNHKIQAEAISTGVFILHIQDQINGNRLTKKIILR